MNKAQELHRTDRFEVRGELGRGGMGAVYRAFDRELGREVALKTIVSVDPDSIYRFKNEFRALADLSHPNLVALHELFHEDNVWFFTMELVPGVDFLSHVRGADLSSPDGVTRAATPISDAVATTQVQVERPPARVFDSGTETLVRPPPLGSPPVPRDAPALGVRSASAHFDRQRLDAALRQLVEGVCALHAAGKLHADLKPANVLVAETGRVVLLDFGLARGRQGDEFYHDASEYRFMGTPAYMAPELYFGAAASEASDWYAVGVVLYEVLTGALPFQSAAATVQGIMPEPPDRIAPGAPADLSTLCMRLLSPKPHDRPGGAELLRLLGAQDRSLDLVDPSADAFVGRAAELAALWDAYEGVLRGRPVRVQVHGTSGFGKTTLLRHFLSSLRWQKNTVVLPGRCYERESVPYKVFDSLIDALSRYLNGLPREEVDALMPRDIRVLARLFPSLLRVKSVGEAPERDKDIRDLQEVSRRATVAKELFGALAERQRLVLFIDDLQWGDIDSARLLGHLLAPPDPPKMLLIVSYRSEEVATNQVLRTLLRSAYVAGADMDARVIVVGPLSPLDARALAERVLGAPRAAANASASGAAGHLRTRSDAIVREADGNPFFLQQLARYVAGGAMPETDVRLGDVIGARLARVPETARRLLETVSVGGRPLPQSIVVQASEITTKAEEALQLLRSLHLVRTTGPRKNDLVESYHDRIREAVVAGLDADRLRGIHRSLALTLESTSPEDPEALTVHWESAGEPAKAAIYAVRAAKQAADALAFDRAAELYRLALKLTPAADPSRGKTQICLSDALRSAGRCPEAAESYLIAARDAPKEEALEWNRLACEQFLISGHLARGREVARSVLDAVGVSLPSTPAGVLFSLLVQRIKVTLYGKTFRERDEKSISREELARVDACYSMATGLSMLDTTLGAVFTSRYLLFALLSGEPRRIARALPFEATHVSSSGNFAAAQKLIRDADALAERTQDAHARGMVKLMGGVVLYFQGRWREALVSLDASLEIFLSQCTGVTWEVTSAHFFGLWALVYLGDWIELGRRAPSLLVGARERGNLYLTHGLRVSAGIITRLMADDIEGARRELHEASEEWSTEGFQVQHFLRLYMGGWIELYADNGLGSWERLKQQWPALRRSLLLQLEDIRLRMLHIRSYSAVAAGLGPGMLRIAERDANSIGRINSLGAKGVAGVVLAAIAVKRGNPPKARRHLEEAVMGFDAAEMPLYAAAARRRLGEQIGGAEGAAMVEAADRAIASQSIVDPAKMANVLAPGFRGSIARSPRSG